MLSTVNHMSPTIRMITFTKSELILWGTMKINNTFHGNNPFISIYNTYMWTNVFDQQEDRGLARRLLQTLRSL